MKYYETKKSTQVIPTQEQPTQNIEMEIDYSDPYIKAQLDYLKFYEDKKKARSGGCTISGTTSFYL